MEEIIASISRIITEDKKPDERAHPASPQADDILDLTDAVNEDGSVRRLTPLLEKPSADPPAAPSTPELQPARAERILSTATSGAAAAAFAQLGSLPRERRREGELPLGDADRTLEDVVRDLLRPLLQAWLNEHLPGIVERLVREEITRVVGEAGLR